MRIEGLKEVVSKYTGHISGAFSFVFDEAENEFIYTSKNSPELEGRILAYHAEMNFSKRSAESKNNICEMTCEDFQRHFILKKLATNIFLGICVIQDSDKLDLALQALNANFKV